MKVHFHQGAFPATQRVGTRGVIAWERAAVLYARLALGFAFLSAVASRFGLWDKTLDMAHFRGFLQYTAEVNSFLPAALIPAVAWAATIAETACAVLLIAGWWLRWVSLASALLLAIFAMAMAISFGVKSPMDYSVFSASSAGALLALYAWRRDGGQASSQGTTTEGTASDGKTSQYTANQIRKGVSA